MKTKNFDEYVAKRLGKDKVDGIEGEFFQELLIPHGQIFDATNSSELHKELFNILWGE